MVNAGDHDALLKEKIGVKLLRVTDTGRDGFILTDFPNNIMEAEQLEEYRGGINSFVHLSVPDEVAIEIEENKCACENCGRAYYSKDVINVEHGINIEKFLPGDGHCFDCGSSDIKRVGNPIQLEATLKEYNEKKEKILPFYDHLGLLVDFDLKRGYDDFPNLKDQIQFNIKH